MPENVVVRDRLFIDGGWVLPAVDDGLTDVINAADGSVLGRVARGGTEDVDRAVTAARTAFETWSQTPPEVRARALAGGVWSSDPERAMSVARRVRTGQVDLNGARFNPAAPFGGYKRSGVGREFGSIGIDEFTEVKAVQR